MVAVLAMGIGSLVDEATVEVETVKVEPIVRIGHLPEPVKAETVELPRISEQERELLERVAMAEAGNQPDEGIAWVVDTILNRVDDDRFPDTITGVCYEKGQFACVPTGAIYKWTPTDKVKEIVNKELITRSNTEVLFFKTKSYHKGRTGIKPIADHYFSK